MGQVLHGSARTTEAVRRVIQRSEESVRALAKRYGIYSTAVLKGPAKQPKKGRLWLDNGSCVRLRPEVPKYVWANDFVEGRTPDGRKVRILNVVDEVTYESVAIRSLASSGPRTASTYYPSRCSRGAYRAACARSTGRS